MRYTGNFPSRWIRDEEVAIVDADCILYGAMYIFRFRFGYVTGLSQPEAVAGWRGWKRGRKYAIC